MHFCNINWFQQLFSYRSEAAFVRNGRQGWQMRKTVQWISILVRPCLFSPGISRALSHCLLCMVCAYLQAAHLAVHISFGLVATDPEDRNHTLTEAHRETRRYIFASWGPLFSFIFYSKALRRNKRNGRSEEQLKQTVCVCLNLWEAVMLKTHLRTHLFSCSPYRLLSAVGGWSLIMFLVVFTNVSFIKFQQPPERHHPSAKVIIALNHLTAYLFGWLSGRRRPAPASPWGR